MAAQMNADRPEAEEPSSPASDDTAAASLPDETMEQVAGGSEAPVRGDDCDIYSKKLFGL